MCFIKLHINTAMKETVSTPYWLITLLHFFNSIGADQLYFNICPDFINITFLSCLIRLMLFHLLVWQHIFNWIIIVFIRILYIIVLISIIDIQPLKKPSTSTSTSIGKIVNCTFGCPCRQTVDFSLINLYFFHMSRIQTLIRLTLYSEQMRHVATSAVLTLLCGWFRGSFTDSCDNL